MGLQHLVPVADDDGAARSAALDPTTGRAGRDVAS
jgi:hypothetical protein